MSNRSPLDEVMESIAESSVASVNQISHSHSNSIFVDSPFFDSDYITEVIDQQHRQQLDLVYRGTRDNGGSFQFRLHLVPRTFCKEVVGQELIEKILSNDMFGRLDGVVDYTISKKGVEVITNSPDVVEPELFNKLSTKVWKLYKTVKLPDNRYKFVFRQMGDPDEMIDSLSKNRIRKISWDTRLDCVNCSQRDCVEYSPSSPQFDSSEFTFKCVECESEWSYPIRPEERIRANQTEEFIRFKMEQFYQTAIGSPE